MIVFQNSLITLTYIPDSEILTVTWTNTEPYPSVKAEQSIQEVIAEIDKFNCSGLLIDASGADVAMEDAAFRTTLNNFISALSQTPVKKVARIITSDHSREGSNISSRSEKTLPFQIYDISNREQAIRWLKESNEPEV